MLPLYLYEETQPDDGLFATSGDQAGGLTRRDAITDEGLAHFEAAYPGEKISKEDLFYYIYGLLDSPDYRERFYGQDARVKDQNRDIIQGLKPMDLGSGLTANR